MYRKNKKIFLLLLFLAANSFHHNLYAHPLTLLPFSHGPGPVFSFGQAVQPKNVYVERLISTWVVTDLHTRLLVNNFYYYGVTDRFTAIFKIPLLAKFKNDSGVDGRGLGNIILEDEVVLWEFLDFDPDFRFRVTQVGRIYLPTNTGKIPSLESLFTTSFFLGVTISNVSQKIYQYTSVGAFITTTNRNKFNFGNASFFDLGFGHSIINNDKLYFMVALELNSEYRQPNRTNGITNYTSGATLIWLGPTFRVSTEHAVIQGGLQYPCDIHLKVESANPINYRATVSIAGVF